MDTLEQWPTKRIVYTGGEPAIQDLRPLSEELHSRGYNIAIETNGTVELNDKNFKETFDIVVNNPGWNLSLQTHKWMGVD